MLLALTCSGSLVVAFFIFYFCLFKVTNFLACCAGLLAIVVYKTKQVKQVDHSSWEVVDTSRTRHTSLESSREKVRASKLGSKGSLRPL